MLPDRLCQLLTAYVDGELSTRQRKAVMRLLHRSPEARALLRQLEEDAQNLRRLPRQTVGRDLSAPVLAAIDAGRLQPTAARRKAAPSSVVPVWVSIAAAAAVLLVISVSTFFFFVIAGSMEGNGPVAVEQQPQPIPDPGPAPHQEVKQITPDGSTDERPVQTPEPERLPMPAPSVVVEGPKPEKEPAKPDSPGVLTKDLSPRMEPFEIIAKPRLSILALRDLDQEKPRKELDRALEGDSAYRLELLAEDSNKGFERLQSTFRAHGFRLLIDQAARSRLKLKLKTNYFLFTEDITPAELAKILAEMGQEDKKAAAKDLKQGLFSMIVINPLSATDHRELSKLLGVDPKQLQPPKASGPLGQDLRKPVANGTAAQVVETLEGQGEARPQPGKPAAKPGRRTALVLPYNPVRPNPSASREVQQFFDSRKAPQKGTIQVLLVLRNS